MVEQAQRLRRPSWRDPRLGIGVLLVAGSVALGSWAVAQADRTTDVLLAVTPLTPGDRLAEAELRPHAIRPDALTEVYLNGDTELPEDAVATRVIGAGELVPATAVGTAADLDLIEANKGNFKVSYSMTGTVLDQLQAWADGEAIQFRDDVYGRDARVLRELRKGPPGPEPSGSFDPFNERY